MDYILHLQSPSYMWKGATVIFRTSDFHNNFLDIGFSLVHKDDNYVKKTGVELAKKALEQRKPGRYGFFELDEICNFLNDEGLKNQFPSYDLTVPYLFAYLFAKKDKSLLYRFAEESIEKISFRIQKKASSKPKVRLRPTYILTQDVRIGQIHKAGEFAVFDPDYSSTNFYWLETGEYIPKQFQPDQNLNIFKKLVW